MSHFVEIPYLRRGVGLLVDFDEAFRASARRKVSISRVVQPLASPCATIRTIVARLQHKADS